MKKVLVAMSGGVDSSVAAILLHRQGFDVVGVTMKTWDYATIQQSGKETGCCNLDSFNDARTIAVEQGFPHYILDLKDEFTGAVIDSFVDEYLAGNTPNPCISCNTHIKWKALFRKAEQLGCDAIATGHYAHIAEEGGRRFIRKAEDETKDQSYVLWGLTQDKLSKTIFPISSFQKVEIRKMLANWGYERFSQKKDSYEICFIPNNDYREFLKTRMDDMDQKIGGGNFVNANGDILGKHEGYPFYTVGQRKGLGKAFGKPMFVLHIDADKNEVMLGEENDLFEQAMLVKNVNWQKRESLQQGDTLEAITKIRYKDKGTLSEITRFDDDHVIVKFRLPVKGIAPGQSAVFYDGNDVWGGGIIAKQIQL